MNFFSKDSKCNCKEVRGRHHHHSIKKYLVAFSVLFAVMLLIPDAKAQFWSSGEQYIRDVYQASLGHAPDQNAINYYLYEMEKGRSYGSIKSEIENSKEAQAYILLNSPKIITFNAQRTNKNNNTWSFLWSTTKADSVAIRFQCLSGVTVFFAGTTNIFPCNEDRKMDPNSGASFSVRNANGRGLIMSARLYPIANDKVYVSAARTISFFIDKSSVPTAPLTIVPTVVPSSAAYQQPANPQVSPKPIIIGPVQNTQVAKTAAPDTLTINDSASLGKNAKRVSWRVAGADSVSVSLSCPPKVSATLVTKGNTKKSFSCAGVGQKFNASDYADFIFTNTTKTVTTVTLKLEPVVSGVVVSSKAVTKNFNLAK